MLISSLISSMALTLAAAQAGPTPEAARDAMDACLTKEIVAALKTRVEPRTFGQQIKDKCPDEAAAYRAAMIAASAKSDLPGDQAREAADDEIAYWLAQFKDDYKYYFDTKEMPRQR